MGWKENRRRKRTWYKHYKGLADRIVHLLRERDDFAAEAILQIIFDLYESRRLHGKKFIASSAYESLRLAVEDSGLDKLSLQSECWGDSRPRPALRGRLFPPEEVRTDSYRLGQPAGLRPGVSPASVVPLPENPDAAELERLRRIDERSSRPMPELPAAALAQLGRFGGVEILPTPPDQEQNRLLRLASARGAVPVDLETSPRQPGLYVETEDETVVFAAPPAAGDQVNVVRTTPGGEPPSSPPSSPPADISTRAPSQAEFEESVRAIGEGSRLITLYDAHDNPIPPLHVIAEPAMGRQEIAARIRRAIEPSPESEPNDDLAADLRP